MVFNTFFWGFWTGVAVTVALGLVLNLYRGWVRTWSAYKKPQLVIQPTRKTPEQVSKEASTAQLKAFVFWAVIVLFVWIGLEFVAPSFARNIRWAFGDIYLWLTGN